MKKIKYFILLFISLFIFNTKVHAADLGVSASAYTVYVGSSVTITVNGDGLTGKVSIRSNNVSVLSGGSDEWLENSKKTLTFKANKVGSATVTVSPVSLAYSDGSGYYTASKSVTINVINKPTPKPPTPVNPGTVTPKSSVNYLSSLEIEGKSITPKFDKETSNYEIELEAGTTNINIKATASHNKASITGTGNKKVSEGVNNFNIVVTAENGSKRTYNIKVTVKEKNPIIVNVDGSNYTVIRKKDQLPSVSAYYSESTVKINDEDIPSYYGEVTGLTLVGLKNSEGVINLFTYDEDKNSYKLYQEFTFSQIIFYPMEADLKNIPKDYSKYNITINDISIPCYKINESDEFVLLYGVNIENNNEGFYIYDSYENTLQRYNDKIFDKAKEEIMVLKSIIIGLFIIVIIIVIASAIQGTTNKLNTNYKDDSKNKKKTESKEKKKEAKLLEKELKRKEKVDKKKSKNKKKLDDTTIIDINDINIKK